MEEKRGAALETHGDALGWFVVPRWGGRGNRSVGSLRGIGLAADVADWRPG